MMPIISTKERWLLPPRLGNSVIGRYEDKAYMWRMINLVDRPDTQRYEIAPHGHGAMGNPAYHILIQSINKILGKKYEF